MRRRVTHAVRAIIRRHWRPADMPACREQIAAAAAALDDAVPGVQGNDALALREQLRVEATQRRQRALPMGGDPRPREGMMEPPRCGITNLNEKGLITNLNGVSGVGPPGDPLVAGDSMPDGWVNSGSGSY